MVALVSWAHFTPVDIFIRASGVVRPDGDVIQIAAGRSGQVEVVLLHEGQIVTAGEVLVRLDSTEQQMRKRNLAEQMELRKSQLRQVQHRRETIRDIYLSEVARLEAELEARRESLAHDLREFRARAKAAAIQLGRTRGDHQRTTALFDAGLVAEDTWLKSLNSLRLAELEYSRALAASPEESSVALVERAQDVANAQFADDQAEIRAAALPIELELAQLELQLGSAVSDEEKSTIRSPAGGRLALVAQIHTGELLEAGQVVGTLDPAPQTRVIEALLPNPEAEGVWPGQSVRLLLGSEFLDGTVRSISPDVRADNTASASYTVIIEPALGDLRLGLALEVRFLTETRTVLDLVLGRITDGFRALGG